MKRFILSFIIALAAFTAFGQDYRTIYQKYSDDERVTAV